MFERRRVAQYQRPLPEVVQQQCRQDPQAPGNAYGFFPEMAHIGVNAFGAGDCQDNGAHRQKRGELVVNEKLHCVVRTERCKNTGVLDNAGGTQQPQYRKPDDRYRAEHRTDTCGTSLLEQEQQDDDDNRQRNHERLERGCRNFKALNRGDHGYGRGNNAIAIKHRRTEQTE